MNRLDIEQVNNLFWATFDTMPEDMPTPVKGITEVERAQLKNLGKNKALMLDE